MYSDYTTIIRLEPFLQRFLCQQFQQEMGKVFQFPPREDFNTLLIRSVSPCPADYRKPDYGDHTFEIALPYSRAKDVSVHNYMSQAMQNVFVNYTKRYLNWMFHDEFNDLVSKLGLTREEAITHLQHNFGFLPEDYDRLIKDYQRWRNRQRMSRYRKKNREGKMAKS